MSDINLTSSMRSTLLSLQNTESLMAQTEERLSTGLKVNSALDDPAAYYTASSLSNRAADLSSLMDSMGQGISAITTANDALETTKSFLEQIDALVANLAEVETQDEWDAIVAQIDDALGQVTNVTKEASYNGVNLVAGVDADLEVYLSEDRTSSSSSITVKSVDATLTGLGLNALDIIWDTDLATSLGKIDTALSAVDAAISKVSSYTSTFSNTYSSIENWENFTSNLVNTLTEGAEKLTLADMNEESANYIALQTRQSLATSALSLASQASQSVLGFF